MRKFEWAILAAVLAPCAAAGQTFALDSNAGLNPRDVKVEPTTYLGRKAIRVVPDGQRMGNGLVGVSGVQFGNGVLELDVTGKPGAGAVADARGFVGLAFHVNADLSKFECFYLRPTNARAEDQERRNHSVQYISFPDFEWPRLRKETPGKYESYADMVAGEWTKMKIQVQGVKARLYVNGAAQPALIVNDLKLGEATGGVALWIGPGTEAQFANLKVSQ